MAALHVAWQAAGAREATPALIQGQAGVLAEPARLAVSSWPGGPPCLKAALDPATLSAQPQAKDGVLHWLRLADATLRPLPGGPGPLSLWPGDSYVAVVNGPGAPDPAQRIAAARFIHLRDYFNADKLAGALLQALRDSARGGASGPGLGVLVIECR